MLIAGARDIQHHENLEKTTLLESRTRMDVVNDER
jgi:hypothetical protein